MFVTNWISTTKIQKISEITNFFRHYFLSRTEVHTESSYEECTSFSEIRFLFCFFTPNGYQAVFPEFQRTVLGDLGIELEALLC